MTDIAKMYGNISYAPLGTFEINSLGVDYFASRKLFVLENIYWNIYLVVYKDDIARTTNINTGISVGVAVAVIFIGLICSVVISYMITEPLKYLESQFNKIKTFGETDRIYTSLPNVHLVGK